MTKFHQGQQVEVRISNSVSYDPPINFLPSGWRKAKIICGIVVGPVYKEPQDKYEVQFPDGSRAVFDVAHIRVVEAVDRKTQQFREGKEVEVWKEVRTRGTDLHQNYVRRWCKASILNAPNEWNKDWIVQFRDGTRGAFDAEHIRAIDYADTSVSPLNYDAPRGPGEQAP